MLNKLEWYWRGFLNSYTQIFFSDNIGFAFILIPVSFLDYIAGLTGMFSVLFTNAIAWFIGFDPQKIKKGYYGFNSLLVGLGLGIYYEPGYVLLVFLIVAAILTLFISVTLEGVIGKYYLPHLSLPFVLALWLLMLSSREFYALSLNERGIYTLNDLYILGGHTLVSLYEWWNQLALPTSLKSYFLSLGAILFQYSVLSGLLISLGLFIYSRIAFILSLFGFFAAWNFYTLIGADISEVGYSYVGFNYILTAIAIGGFFIIPNINSFIWVLLIIPMVAIVTVSLGTFLSIVQLPVYALPFNFVVLLFLYVLKFRITNKSGLHTFFVQRNSPERNLYSFLNYNERFSEYTKTPVKLPFYGEWMVTQGHNGSYTHKNDWKHAWDFEMVGDDGKTFRNKGNFAEDYYCFNKPVLAPGDGLVEEVINDIEDNPIGTRNLLHNWGNTVVIKHSENFYSKLSHLKKDSVKVKKGDKVRPDQTIGLCGNSGNSPYPHLHFQLQSTPYVGSKTLYHPISNYYKYENSSKKLVEAGIPEQNEIVSNIQINSALKKAFMHVPGQLMNFMVTGMNNREAAWEVKIDNYLNPYIECQHSGSKAWFETGPAMIHFVHFEGDRSCLLYFYYLSAYKVCFGYGCDLVLNDKYPLDLIFDPNKMVLQDMVAPFYRYLQGVYELEYPFSTSRITTEEIQLNGKIKRMVFNRTTQEISFRFILGEEGLKEFYIYGKDVQITAKCE